MQVALESKKLFVEYISHEAKGPLQDVRTGLEVHLDELDRYVTRHSQRIRARKKNEVNATERLGGGGGGAAAAANSESSPFDNTAAFASANQLWCKERMEQIGEIVEASAAAKNILNNLLSYDKIENGMLLMEKEDCNILPFVSDIVESYKIPVSDTLSSMNPSANDDTNMPAFVLTEHYFKFSIIFDNF